MNRAICPVCKKRLVHRSKSSVTCYRCFSELVKAGKWQEFMFNEIMNQ